MILTVAIIHVVISFTMGVLILLHSGRGGGLSDMFGGMGAQAQGSTVMERNLDRVTLVCALIFTFTTVALGLLMKGS
ncbi:MAG TPA: preprotein translocase subunit SecG [Acidimicrobiales bacterium]|jgi:preprotein translocase subunit SecG|nr:preprotein translocase subunit SecG [Acidimicrobiales bacterium]